jgi:metallo-beta-lactamase family protein
MATGGRVLHHLAQYVGDHRNMIILTGYQAPGTRGAWLASGRSPIRIHAQDVAVRAEVVQIESASAHADANQLLSWLHIMPNAPSRFMWCMANVKRPTCCDNALSTKSNGAQ